MGCYRPIKAHQLEDGEVIFKEPMSTKIARHLAIKCGQCIGCRLAKTRDWAIRCMHESQMWKSNSFLTLTYDNKNLPKNRGVDLREWQLFAKRLREKVGPFRFMACGEYGDKNQRPHYHAIVFGQDFAKDRKQRPGNRVLPLWESDVLSGVWGKGYCTIGSVDFDSAAYVASYVMKKRNAGKSGKFDDHYERLNKHTGEVWTVKPEFGTMSKKPGLGSTWWAKYGSEVYPDDFVVMKGMKFRPPAFYDKKMEKEDPYLAEQVAERRKLAACVQADQQTPARLKIREACAEAKLAWRQTEGEM